MENNKDVILKVSNLKKYFKVANRKVLKAVDDVSLDIKRGETLGLVGESGCGKSTLGRTIIKLYEPTDGNIFFEGKDVTKIKRDERKRYTRSMQMIFQDPYACINPRMTVADIVSEGMDIHNMYNGKERQKKVYEFLESVGLNREHANRFPHEFSGGQRQRIGIARALAIQPKFIICDEPISALDVSIQAQIINLLEDLQKDMGLTYLFIAHDLSMVEHISDRIAVMYLGSVVEIAETKELMQRSVHPYTRALLSAVPIADPNLSRCRNRVKLDGDVPSPVNIPVGCRFQTRCYMCQDICRKETPKLKEISPNHFVSCYMVEKEVSNE